jgi:hypothetical protein
VLETIRLEFEGALAPVGRRLDMGAPPSSEKAVSQLREKYFHVMAVT